MVPGQQTISLRRLRPRNPRQSHRETYTLFTINRDGTNPTQLFQSRFGIDYPQWLPGEEHLVFFHSGELVILRDDTTDPLTTNILFFPCTQHWSPDGKLIAMEYGRCNLADYLEHPHPYTSIYLMNTDGTGLQLLTDNISNNFHATFSPANGKPASIWSNDSKQLLIHTDWLYRSNSSIYILKADGSGIYTHPTSLN